MLYPSFASSMTAFAQHFDTPGIREAIYMAVMYTSTAVTSRRSCRIMIDVMNLFHFKVQN